MSKCNIIDTFSDFLTFWTKAQLKTINEQIEEWSSVYMSKWSELLEKQLENYLNQNVNWKQIAKERIFPFLSNRLPEMQLAHKNLLNLCKPTYYKAQEVLKFDTDIIFVIYVGIGCGAGWATIFDNSPAVLFGLENIAECGWSESELITNLIAHEIGHIVHRYWRIKHKNAIGSGPWWQLYSEGFAKLCEEKIIGKDIWNKEISINDNNWLDWCENNIKFLAKNFLRLVDAGESVKQFFGHWFDVSGKKQCGYFLGYKLVKELEANINIKEIALLEDIEELFRQNLKKIVEN